MDLINNAIYNIKMNLRKIIYIIIIIIFCFNISVYAETDIQSLNNMRGSLSNINSGSVQTNKTNIKTNKNENYDWSKVYVFFFIVWGAIFLIAFGNNGQEESQNLLNNYKIKYKNKRPIKPEISEFGFDTTSYEKIDKIIKTENSTNFFYYVIPIMSMWLVAELFETPSHIFPIFYKEPFGFIFALIFYFASLIAIKEIQNKYERFVNEEAIKNYYSYTNALSLDEEAKEREYWQQKNYWLNLSPFEFEVAIGKLFKYLGYDVKITQKSRDGGIDILVKKENSIKGIQCKHYKGKVGAREVRELWGVKDYFKFNDKVLKLDGVIMVALSGVSKDGNEFISRFQNYELWTIDTIIAKANNTNYLY